MRKWIFFVSRRIFYVILFWEKGNIYCFDPAQQPFTRTFKYLFFTLWESDDVKHAKKCIMPYFISFQTFFCRICFRACMSISFQVCKHKSTTLYLFYQTTARNFDVMDKTDFISFIHRPENNVFVLGKFPSLYCIKSRAYINLVMYQ